ncbi:MAG: nicotinate-nucleotide adenylyltransferase [Defluviitaleaceae bacterium]|nr:nicotinate-nucleotide adenylyltransferase [Defluviitaleaceae bacterium]
MKIGIMGGTFDPIHLGHLHAGQQVLTEHELDMMLFIPAGNPVFKQGREFAHPEDRYAMCVLATSANPKFFVSRIEIEREAVTYTIDTIRQLHIQYPNAKFYFVLGTDAMASFPKWRESAEILELCTPVEVSRSKLDISSTEIRERIAHGKPIHYLVHDAVADYIKKNGLYRSIIADLRDKLELELNRPRFLHSLSVMEEAEKLGRHFGEDTVELEKLRIAALLHDCAKNLCDELSIDEIRKICGSPLGEFFDNSPTLAHCYVGAALAKSKYGITDQEILDAIAHHTFGNSIMSLMEKIVYLADFFEPTRPPDPEREKARKLAYEDIDKAMMFVLRLTIDNTKARKKQVYHKSFEALKFLEEMDETYTRT